MGSTEMNINIEYGPDFMRAAKVLAKRYNSFTQDLRNFINELKKNPKSGDDLGSGIRKIRMAIASKGKGKRGGARVITLTLVVDEENSTITLLYIYDKSDLESISKSKIKELISSHNINITGLK